VKKRIPIKEGLFVIPSKPDETPLLVASKCPRCHAIMFPEKPSCPNCQAKDLETLFLKGPGKLYSYTSVLQRPSMFYKGEIPYFLGYVELPEGIRIRALLTEVSLETLRLDLDMELVLERLHDDEEGNEVITYKFRPIPLAQ
jgi:uncharacterized OB-fold protein